MSDKLSEAPFMERRRPIEEMSRDELVAMFPKVRAQMLQIARDKKQAVENFEACSREKDEMRTKAIAVVQRCKGLEEKMASYNQLKEEGESKSNRLEEQMMRIQSLEALLRSEDGSGVGGGGGGEGGDSGAGSKEMEGEVKRLHQSLLEFQTLCREKDEEIEGLRDASAQAKDAVTTATASVEMQQEVQSLAQEIGRLRGAAEEHDVAAAKAQEVNQKLIGKVRELGAAMQTAKQGL
ncbi:hypothetical protein B484DRAFT_476196, partial [Ochromonadaceae sp. CCMP2298]